MRRSAEKDVTKEVTGDGRAVDVQKFVEESKGQIRELQLQYDTLRSMLLQNLGEQSPVEYQREIVGMHDNLCYRAPANEYTSASEEAGEGADSFPQKFGVLKAPSNIDQNLKANQPSSQSREKKLLDRGSNAARP